MLLGCPGSKVWKFMWNSQHWRVSLVWNLLSIFSSRFCWWFFKMSKRLLLCLKLTRTGFQKTRGWSLCGVVFVDTLVRNLVFIPLPSIYLSQNLSSFMLDIFVSLCLLELSDWESEIIEAQITIFLTSWFPFLRNNISAFMWLLPYKWTYNCDCRFRKRYNFLFDVEFPAEREVTNWLRS